MSSFPMVTANIALKVPPGLIQDINTHWLMQASGPIAMLGAPVAAGDSSITLSAGVSLPAPTIGQIALGITQVPVSLLIDNEPLLVTLPVQPGATVLNVTRGLSAFPFLADLAVPPAQTHAAGAAVMQLVYTDPWTMIGLEALTPWAQNVVKQLGSASATFGFVATGSVTAS